MRKASIIGVAALGLLVAVIVIRSANSDTSNRASDRSREYIEKLKPASSTLPEDASDYSYNFKKTLVYRFEVTGDLMVHHPSEAGKEPIKAAFTMEGDLAIGPARNGRGLVCEMRNIDVHSESTQEGAKMKRLDGRSAAIQISPRGQLLSVTGDDQVATFMSHLEFILPPSRENDWGGPGKDPAGEFTATYHSKGVFLDGDRPVLKIAKEKKYQRESGSIRGFSFMPEYSATGYFDVQAGRLAVVELSGEIPEPKRKDGVRLSGQVRMSFVFDREEDEALAPPVPRRLAKKRQNNSRSKKTRNRKKMSFSDVAPYLHSPKPSARANAVIRLTVLSSVQAREAMLSAAEDREFVVRAAAAQALHRFRTYGPAIEKLIYFVKSDTNPLVRMRAAKSLRGSSSSEVRTLLESVAAKDSSKFVRKAAHEALAHPIEGEGDEN